MNEKLNEEGVIDLRELFQVILKKIWLIIFVAIATGGIALSYTFLFVDPLYKASTMMYVNNNDISVGNTKLSISSGDIYASQALVETYSVIVRSRNVLNDVIADTNLPYTYEQLAGMVSSEAVNETQVFMVTVTSKDPHEAEKIANSIAKILPPKIAEIVSGSEVKIIDYAIVPAHKASPSYSKNAVLGSAVGAIITIAIITLMYIFDDVIHGEDYITNNYPDIPLLAVVPDMKYSKGSGYGYYQSAPKKQPPVNKKNGGANNG